MKCKPESRAAVLKRLTLRATARHVSERTGKTNIRLEVKWSDCANGEIPEPPANAQLKINAGRWASRRGADVWLPLPISQGDVNKDRKPRQALRVW